MKINYKVKCLKIFMIVVTIFRLYGSPEAEEFYIYLDLAKSNNMVFFSLLKNSLLLSKSYLKI